MNIKIDIPFLSWTGKSSLSIEIDASVEAKFQLRAALQKANLAGADLAGAKEIPSLVLAQCSIVPEDGAFLGWKKCQKDILVQVQIPADAKRSNAIGRKCRASKVKVLKIIGAEKAISLYDGKTEYVVGKITKANAWNDNRFVECAGGIHFFITRAEAEAYS